MVWCRIVGCLVLGGIVAGGLPASGCAPISTLATPSTASQPPSGELRVRGDWNDVKASVFSAIRDQEVALVSETLSDNQVVFEFLTVRDEPVSLTAVRNGENKEDVEIILTSRFGHFGDPGRERMLMERVAARLRDLAGVDFRPIR